MQLEFIMVPLIVGICVAGTYGLFELFARRKERLALIEKIGDKIDAAEIAEKLRFPSYFPKFSFSALKAGCLLTGAGFGLLVGFFINLGMAASGLFNHGGQMDEWYWREMGGVAYGASVLLFGGAALILAFVIELKQAKKE